METGEIDISQIVFDSKSRDDIPRVLKGLQYLYITVVKKYLIYWNLEFYQRLIRKMADLACRYGGY